MQILHQGGGSGSVTSTLHLSLGLKQAGFDIRFVCPPNSEVEALAREGGLQVLPLALEPNRRRSNAAKILRMLQEYPVELINSQSARDRAALAWLALTRRLHVPLVVTRRQLPRTFALENWLVSSVASRVVAVSRSVGAALVRRGTSKRKLAVIPNGLVRSRVDVPVTTSSIDEWRTRIGWEPTRRTLGIIARLKDQDVVLRALPHVTIPVRLVLVGVAPNVQLDRLAEQVPARHRVVLLPFIPDVRPLYELLELALLPSRMEGLSQALLEAMALAKPVIASAAAGNLDLITDGVDGRLVRPLDHVAWSQAIEELLRDSSLAAALGAAARHTARTTYALEHTVKRTGELYYSIMAHG